jgi:putative ABC transport system permease protein
MRSLLRDLRQGAWALNKAPKFALAVIATLSLAIAANTLVFALLDAVLLRPLSYPDGDQIMVLRWRDAQGHFSQDVFASAYFGLRTQSRPFNSVAATYPIEVGVNLSDIGVPRYVQALRVSREYFTTLGVSPFIGRDFAAAEDEPYGPHVVILSYDLWQGAFNGTKDVLEHSLKLNGETYRIIGVEPAGFRSYPKADLWTPLQLSPTNANTGLDYRVVGRLQSGMTLAQAQSDLDRMTIQPQSVVASTKGVLVIQSLHEFATADVHNSLLTLFGAVFLVLLIACINASILFLVRTSSRSSEIAVRLALGSTLLRLVRIFLIEGAVLAFISGLLGLIMAKEMLPVVLQFAPSDLPADAPISIDGRVIVFVLLVFMITTLLLGTIPAIRFLRMNVNAGLKENPRVSGGGIRRTRSLQALVGLQTALTLILLVGTLLLLRSVQELEQVPPGFDPRQVVVAQFSTAKETYMTGRDSARLLQLIMDSIGKTPGIEAIGSINGLPLEKGLNLPVYPTDSPDRVEHAAEYRVVSADYFKAMHIPVISGRPFLSSDAEHTTPVAIVNETLARRWWPGQLPNGKFVKVSRELGDQFSDSPRHVVGIVGDIHETGLDEPPHPTIFVPLTQGSDSITSFANKTFLTSIVVRTADPASLIRQFRSSVKIADLDLPLASLRPLTDVVHASWARPRFYAWLTTAFGMFALLLTVLGLFGLLSYYVSLRSREIGIRMAFGATRTQIVNLVISQATVPLATGLAVGLLGAFFLQPLLRNMIYNAETSGLNIVVIAVVGFAIAATLASLLPAIRAASITPMAVLRDE